MIVGRELIPRLDYFFRVTARKHADPVADHQTRGVMPSESDNFADRLVAATPDAIVYADAEGVIRRWNGGAARIFGFAEAEALGQPLDLIIPENLRGRHWQGYRETMRTGRSRYAEGQLLSVPAIRKDGVRISVEFTIVPFADDDGRMVGVAAIMRDATARFQEMRQLRQALAAQEGSVAKPA
jgi:PAS domain S-box-containing protein